MVKENLILSYLSAKDQGRGWSLLSLSSLLSLVAFTTAKCHCKRRSPPSLWASSSWAAASAEKKFMAAKSGSDFSSSLDSVSSKDDAETITQELGLAICKSTAADLLPVEESRLAMVVFNFSRSSGESVDPFDPLGPCDFMHLAPGAKIRLWFSSQELLNLNQKIFHALSLSILLLLRLPRGSHQETEGWSWSRGTFWENQHRHIWIATGSGGRINALEPK